ncbi:probable ubiquitin-conjugating enzyme E2 24 isoform X2 [Pistacia vera]|uniref:probable ubiquitin-conjugating enzyme E2 24 isoform X2 n=1 Tax=Pistacia vera TaxID=55513 RepID=UPI001262D610|nr:probable ubiquitin-conjugating enzyme E2 24 isoform X2 [Pistacia vera]
MDVLVSDSDWESFSESGSSDGQEEMDTLYGGHASSILSSLEESIGKIDEFLSFDRGFIHGDIVCSVTDPSGQMGRVINIDTLVDLENMHGKVMKEVCSKNILRIRSISAGDYVVQGAWLGRVDKVIDSVTVVFDDGTKCEVTAVDQEKLLPVSTNKFFEDSQFPYYPGQRVQLRLSNASKSVRWLCGTWKENHVEGTVSKADAGLVYVDWLASALTGCDFSLPSPSRLQDSKNLTLLSGFSHANWQLGDWCMLPAADCKGILEPFSVSSSACHNKKFERGLKRRNLCFTVAEIFVIIGTKTKVDVVWQDGSYSLGVESATLLPINVVNAHEFWPEQFVQEKGICDDPHISNSHRWGVVRGVDAKEKTVKVQWKTKALNEATDPIGDQMEETLSAYELLEHPDFSYCYGDVVFRLVHNRFTNQADKDQKSTEFGVVKADEDQKSTEIGMVKEATMEGQNYGWDKNDCPDKGYPSCIGIVTGFKDGSVEVKWAAGFTTKVAPNEIYGMDKYEGSATTPVLHAENDEELNQEIHDKQKGKNLPNLNGAGENCNKYPCEFSSFFLPRAAIGFFASITTSLFGSRGSTPLSCPTLSGHISGDANESDLLLKKEISTTCDNCSEPHSTELQTFGQKNLCEEVEDNQEKDGFKLSTACQNPYQFRQFDMVSDCSDHHFLDASKGLALPQVKRAWMKKVQQEWSILEANLPETIYVRIYEERMDLLRVAIIGAPATPYHDGLFFFDIFLPPDYPHEPPLVHYHSGGLRVNPNLYESGKVCLSLLNTWTGTGTEVWNPGSSTILQVLLSLQALVLNEKPYFNEAGYDEQMGRAEGEKNSVSYNENAFLVTCKSMLYLLRKPPKHFEVFVEEHFIRQSNHILSACKAYMEGAPVGCALGCRDSGENSVQSSKGFKIMLAKLFPKLVEVFSSKGIDCSQFTEPEN